MNKEKHCLLFLFEELFFQDLRQYSFFAILFLQSRVFEILGNYCFCISRFLPVLLSLFDYVGHSGPRYNLVFVGGGRVNLGLGKKIFFIKSSQKAVKCGLKHVFK